MLVLTNIIYSTLTPQQNLIRSQVHSSRQAAANGEGMKALPHPPPHRGVVVPKTSQEGARPPPDPPPLRGGPESTTAQSSRSRLYDETNDTIDVTNTINNSKATRVTTTKKRLTSRKNRKAKRQAVQQHDADDHTRGNHGTSSAKKRPRTRLITDYLLREPPPKRPKHKYISRR